MDINETNTILAELQAKSATHPNTTSVWINYVNLKKTRLENTLKLARDSLSLMETIPDLSQENLVTLISYMESMREL